MEKCIFHSAWQKGQETVMKPSEKFVREKPDCELENVTGSYIYLHM